MRPNQVVTVLGFPPTHDQFEPFEFPTNCAIELSSIVDGTIVRARFTSLPPPAPLTRDRHAALLAVSFNYIQTTGIDGSKERTASAHISWLALIEQLTRASIATIANNGAFKIHAIPTHGVVLRGFEGEYSVTVCTAGVDVEQRASINAPTMREVIGACSAILCTPVLDSHAVSGAATGRYISEDDNLLMHTSKGPLYSNKLVSKKTMRLTPLPICFKCSKHVAPLERSCSTSARDNSIVEQN